jgi:hypothetical protein
MRKSLTFFVFAILLLPAPVQAVEPVTMAEQGILGGYMIDLEGIPASNDNSTLWGEGLLTDIQVVEVYTATWCENCVDSEHALMESLEGKNATVLVHHRYIGESQDPFGSQEGDDRWIEFYGEGSNESVGMARAPPTVVFDGSRMKVGSTPHGDSLYSDYSQMFADKHEYSNMPGGDVSMQWDGNNSTGVFHFNFNAPDGLPLDLIWNHRLMVVEHSAYFPEGSNGLEYYEDVVRAVFDLTTGEVHTSTDDGYASEWSGPLTLPAAWDGNDLSLVLVHEWLRPAPDCCAEDSEEDSGLLPSFLAPLGIIAMGAAALTRRD